MDMNKCKWFDVCLYIGEDWYYTQSYEEGVVFYHQEEDKTYTKHIIPEGYQTSLIAVEGVLLLFSKNEHMDWGWESREMPLVNIYDPSISSLVFDKPAKWMTRWIKKTGIRLYVLDDKEYIRRIFTLTPDTPGPGYDNLMDMMVTWGGDFDCPETNVATLNKEDPRMPLEIGRTDDNE